MNVNHSFKPVYLYFIKYYFLFYANLGDIELIYWHQNHDGFCLILRKIEYRSKKSNQTESHKT